MSKAIMLSIKPQWVAKILNGEKTIEVRKQFPKDYVGWIYIYCTKDKKGIFKERHNGYTLINQNKWIESDFNGKVVARFYCDRVSKYYNAGQWVGEKPNDPMNIICSKACITRDDLDDYCEGKYFYTIHISQLEIFDEPKELNEFMPQKWDKCGIKDKNGLYQCNKCPYAIVYDYGGECNYKPLTKAPSNYCYVEVEKQ